MTNNTNTLEPMTPYDIAVRDFKVEKYDTICDILKERAAAPENQNNPIKTLFDVLLAVLTDDKPKPEDYK